MVKWVHRRFARVCTLLLSKKSEGRFAEILSFETPLLQQRNLPPSVISPVIVYSTLFTTVFLNFYVEKPVYSPQS